MHFRVLFDCVLIFSFGTAVGSFINAFEYRLRHKEPIAFSRSRCPNCHHLLAWFDLIPLLSFVLLRGRCRYCGERISLQYPLVELVTGFLFIAFYVGGRLGNLEWAVGTHYLLLFFILACLEIIFLYDLKYSLIPDEVVLPASLITLIYQFFAALFGVAGCPISQLPSSLFNCMFNYLGSGIGAAVFFLFLAAITRGKGMGGGDVKLAVLMGLVLGFPGIVYALYIAFISGAVVSLFLIFLRKKKFGQTVPFGPFLVAGTLLIMFLGGVSG
ncbi:MAG: prepilin peptidase [Chloroflexota bacterium]|nr:MAG: prepilin peptidase [Chloroflexota bacterium]